MVYRCQWPRRTSVMNSTSHLELRPIRVNALPHHCLSSTFQPLPTKILCSWLWNTLPQKDTSAPSLTVFRKHLTTYLFQLFLPLISCSIPAVTCHFRHYNHYFYLLTNIHLRWVTLLTEWRNAIELRFPFQRMNIDITTTHRNKL